MSFPSQGVRVLWEDRVSQDMPGLVDPQVWRLDLAGHLALVGSKVTLAYQVLRARGASQASLENPETR